MHHGAPQLAVLLSFHCVDSYWNTKREDKIDDKMGWGLVHAENHAQATREETRVGEMEQEERVSSEFAKECPQAKRFDYDQECEYLLDFDSTCGRPELDSIYLPSADFYRCSSLRSQLPPEKKKRDDIMRALHRLQNPDDCNKPANPWHLVKLPTFGLGSDVWHTAEAIMYNWQGGFPSLVSNSRWRFSDNKCGAGWSCFLTPLSR
jgi:hypothetical protein